MDRRVLEEMEHASNEHLSWQALRLVGTDEVALRKAIGTLYAVRSLHELTTATVLPCRSRPSTYVARC
jgi:hypothetical protein